MTNINHLRTELSSFIIFVILILPAIFFMIYFGYSALIMALTFIGEYVLWNILYNLKVSFRKTYAMLSGYALIITFLLLFLIYIMTHGYIAPAGISSEPEILMKMAIISNLFFVYLIFIEWLYLAFVCYLFKMPWYLFISILGGVIGVMLCEAIFLL